MITANAQQITRFMARQGGAAIDPAIEGARQLVDANAITELCDRARQAPVRLSELHQGAWRACLAGTRLIWDDSTPPQAAALAPRLHAFAARAGLSFVELVVTADAAPRTVDIEARARYELFGPRAQRAIADALADTLVEASLAGAAP